MSLFSRRVGVAVGLLVLAQALGCKSPEDHGFAAGAQYMAPMAAIGSDTSTMPCPERLALYEEFIGRENKRADMKSAIEGARDKEGFDAGLERLAKISVGVFRALEQTCPEETPRARELAAGVAKELGIEAKVPSLGD